MYNDENGEKLTNRSIYSLTSEWAGHNISFFGYKLFNNEERMKQTETVNLDYNFSDNSTLTKVGTIIIAIQGCL